MLNDRGLPYLLVMYFSIIGTLFLGMGLCAASLLQSAGQPIQARRAASFLDERIAAAREIKARLARPPAPLERLPPVTATLANPQGPKYSAFDKPRKQKPSTEALNAMAMEVPDSGGDSAHAHGPPDRGGISGW